MTLEELRKSVAAGQIDTVLIAMVDMQGRLMGKRCHATYFVDKAWQESRCCDYLLATDLEMATPDGYAAASWDKGYGDYVMRPDIATLRVVPWLEATALVLCDVLEATEAMPVDHDPRHVLARQIERVRALNLEPMAAIELEFFLFAEPYDPIGAPGRAPLRVSGYNDDYSLLHTSQIEGFLRPLRNHLVAAGVPVECTKGEAGQGQVELNLRYGPAMVTADQHVIAKQAAKEIATAQGRAACFMAKWDQDQVGSASHIHLSLTDPAGNSACHDPQGPFGLSQTMQHFMAGLLAYGADGTCFHAPYVNSYKRLVPGTFAPTRQAWTVDNRTSAYRLCGQGGSAVRIECRVPGADMTPHLALAALLAAGLAGIEEELPLSAPARGNVYDHSDVGELPPTLDAAARMLKRSQVMRAALGDGVVDHYTRAALWEVAQANSAVTDHEITRGFDRA